MTSLKTEALERYLRSCIEITLKPSADNGNFFHCEGTGMPSDLLILKKDEVFSYIKNMIAKDFSLTEYDILEKHLPEELRSKGSDIFKVFAPDHSDDVDLDCIKALVDWDKNGDEITNDFISKQGSENIIGEFPPVEMGEYLIYDFDF